MDKVVKFIAFMGIITLSHTSAADWSQFKCPPRTSYKDCFDTVGVAFQECSSTAKGRHIKLEQCIIIANGRKAQCKATCGEDYRENDDPADDADYEADRSRSSDSESFN